MKTWWQRNAMGIDAVLLVCLAVLVVGVFLLWSTARAEHEAPPPTLPHLGALSYQNTPGYTHIHTNDGQRIILREVVPGYSVMELPNGQRVDIREAPRDQYRELHVAPALILPTPKPAPMSGH